MTILIACLARGVESISTVLSMLGALLGEHISEHARLLTSKSVNPLRTSRPACLELCSPSRSINQP